MAFGFLEQAAVGIGHRLMRLIRAPFSVKINRRIPWIVGRAAWPVLPRETLLAGPGLQQRAIHREVLGRQQPAAAGLRDDIFKEGSGDVALQQPITIFVKVVGTHTASSMPRPTNAAKQQVVFQLLHQHPLAPH